MAEPDSLFYFGLGFGFFFLLSLQLLRWMPNPPWTSGEVPGHRSDIPGRQRNAQLCIISGCTCCYGTAGDQNTKTQGRKEKKKKKKGSDLSGPEIPSESPPGLSSTAQDGHTLQRSVSLGSILGAPACQPHRGRVLGSQAGGNFGASLRPKLPSPPARMAGPTPAFPGPEQFAETRGKGPGSRYPSSHTPAQAPTAATPFFPFSNHAVPRTHFSPALITTGI